jgi:hypothetical protein
MFARLIRPTFLYNLRVYSLAVRGLSSTNGVASTSINVAKPPSIAKPATITEAPAVATPITSPRIKENQTDQNYGLVNQDISSRPLAHIISGGFSRL